MTRLVLIRHGEQEAAARGRCYGSLDIGLSPAGEAQAHRLAHALSELELTAVISSPLRRAVRTAEPIAAAHGLTVAVNEALCELDFGQLEGRSFDEVAATEPELYQQWMTDPTTVVFPGGESFHDLHRRTLRAVDELRAAHADQTIVLVTHGGVIRAIVADALGLQAKRIFQLAVEPARLSVLDWTTASVVLQQLNGRCWPYPG